MRKKKKRYKSLSPYFEKQSRSKSIANKKQHSYVPCVSKTSDIRKIATEVFGHPYGIKANTNA